MDNSVTSHLVFAALVLLNLGLWVWPWTRVIYLRAAKKQKASRLLYIWSVAGFWVTGILIAYFLQPALWLTDAAEVLSSPGAIVPTVLAVIYAWIMQKEPSS